MRREPSPSQWLVAFNHPPHNRAVTVADIEAALDFIRDEADNNQSAHYDEDKLHQRVLGAIARGVCVDPAACADAALKTGDLSFYRWYA